MINLHIEPRKTISWETFTKDYPPYSIALDGFVDGPTRRDSKGPYANFDHHSLVDRISTRSTADQVHMEINLGLFETFRKDGIPTANVYVNDVDEDTCLAYWLLVNHEQIGHHAYPNINRLVYCNDRLDCTGGTYPFGDTEFLRTMAWIFEPYRSVRQNAAYGQFDQSLMEAILASVGSRICDYCMGKAGQCSINKHFEVLNSFNGWSFVKETSTSSRMFMFASGVNAFLSDRGHGIYVLGRKSTWINFPLDKIYEALNNRDENITEANRWGGSNTIGGSPRETGSTLPPEAICGIINGILNKGDL